MKRKKTYNFALYTLHFFTACLLGNELYDAGEYYYKLYKNPYREQEIELSKDMTTITRGKQIMQVFDNLSQTEVMQLARKLDPQIISGLENLCEQNPYIDLNLVAERISTIDVSYKKLSNNFRGLAYQKQRLLFIGTYIELARNNPEISQTLYHELLHVIMPTVDDCTFLEEGISSLWCQKYYGKHLSAYDAQQKIIMLLEVVIGEEPFFEMKSTGSAEPIKKALKSLGYDDTFINQLFFHMDQYQDCYYKLSEAESEREINKLQTRKQELRRVLEDEVYAIYQDYLSSLCEKIM